MRSAEAHREAMIVAADTLEELEVDQFERIDVFETMASAGVKLMFRELDCARCTFPRARALAPARS